VTRDFQLGRWQSICKPSAYYDWYFKFQTVLSSSLNCGPFNWAQQHITLNTKSISGKPTRLSRSSNQGKVSAVACSRSTASDEQNGPLSSRKQYQRKANQDIRTNLPLLDTASKRLIQTKLQFKSVSLLFKSWCPIL
jgi:hypothetical protein